MGGKNKDWIVHRMNELSFTIFSIAFWGAMIIFELIYSDAKAAFWMYPFSLLLFIVAGAILDGVFYYLEFLLPKMKEYNELFWLVKTVIFILIACIAAILLHEWYTALNVIVL